MTELFKKDERLLLEAYLNQDAFAHWRTFDYIMHCPDQRLGDPSSTLAGFELIIRPECNQKCEYCYIARYGKTLYPFEERIDNEQILKNLRIFLNYVFNEREIYMHHWELFAGDLFYDDLYFDVLDVFYEILEPLHKKYRPVFVKNAGLILTPTNFSFLHDDAKADRVNEYIAKFAKLNWDVGFSVSTDGKYAIDTRENRPLEDEWFDKLFQWVIDHPKNGFHPILSASNIKNSIKNYEWWRDMYKKHLGEDMGHGFLPYWLEARNDEWNDESIADYLKLLDFMVEDRFKMCNNNIDQFAYHIFKGDGENGTLPRGAFVDQIDITIQPDMDPYERMGCSISRLFIVNLGNLSMPGCHRLNYKQFRGGNFIVEDDKIVGIDPFNVTGYLALKMLPARSMPKCTNCAYNLLCKKGCLGAQFEASGEVLLPCISVCRLEKAICAFLVRKYYHMGVLRSARNQGLLTKSSETVYEAILRDEEGEDLCRLLEN